jgi:hypothetical protein
MVRVLSMSLALLATGASARADAAGPRVAVAAPRQGTIDLDGRLDEAAWAAAAAHGEFWQREPQPGAPPRFATEFRVLYDATALYVGVRAFDPEPTEIRGRLTRRDVESSSDWIVVNIDSYHDRRTAFGFGVNPAGVQVDQLHFNDTEVDNGWDAVWESATRVDDLGWVVELRIPYSQLRFAGVPEQAWGLQVIRKVQRTQELTTWAPWPREASQDVSLYGTITGIRDIAPSRRIELLPYVLGGAELYAADDGDPLNDGTDAVLGAGADLKLGLGPSFTLSATINPDFGQVEADPSQVNLSANEIFFQEKRPFFLEGTDIFRYSLGQGDGGGSVETLFYTRRIGAAPHGDPLEEADHADAPDATTIYGAAKLSGKTAGGWSVGALDAVTGQESATVAVDGSDDRDRVVIEPLTNYAVARVRKDLRDGRTTVGAAATSVHRSLDGVQLDWLHDQAYTGGVEVQHRWAEDTWSADLRLAGSHVRGSAEAIDRTQRASQRYYQRPDADHLDYDPTRTSLSGAALLWSVGKTAGGHWRAVTGSDTRLPGFEANDLGFQRGADYYTQWLWGQYREDRPGRIFRDYGINHNEWVGTSTAPEFLNWGGNVNGWMNLLNYWGAGGGGGVNYNYQDPSYLRGGPMLRTDVSYVGWVNFWSDSRRAVHGSLDLNGAVAPASGSSGWNVAAGVVVQPRSNIELELSPSISVGTEDNQYVDAPEDDMGDPHHVLTRLHSVTTALTVRASYTYSPTLSLQLYAQPFIAAGRASEYKEAVRPGADSYDDRYHIYTDDEIDTADDVATIDTDGDGTGDYSFELLDFNVRELRSNLVLRWEYRPGSTLFLIWSHGRSSSITDGRYHLADDLSSLADEPGEHVVLAKLTYWLGL